MHMLFTLFVAALAAGTTMRASADILNVPADFPTIQAAIDAAEDGDEIVLAVGTYILTDSLGTFGPLTGITLRSTDPADPAVIAATRIVVDALSLYAGAVDLEIAGLTLSGSTWRDIVHRPAGTLVIRDTVIVAAPGSDEPGLFLLGEDGDRLELRRVHFVGDTGRIGGNADEVVIDNCSIEGRTTTKVVDVQCDTLLLSNMVFDGADEERWFINDPTDRLVLTEVDMIDVLSPINILILNPTDIELVDCRFENVRSSHPGLIGFMPIGTVFASVIAERCEFVSNTVTGSGTLEAACINGANVEVRDCLFLNNHTGSGAIVSRDSFIVENCRIEGNTGALAAGARLGTTGGPASIVNTEFINNGSRNLDGTAGNVGIVRLDRPLSDLTPMLIDGCAFVGNSALRGGAITGSLAISGEGLVVRRSRFFANYAEEGGVYGNARLNDFNDQSHLPGNSPLFEDCVFVGNTALNSAVAVGSFQSLNSTFTGNTALQQGQLGHGTFAFTNTLYVEPNTTQDTFGPAASQYTSQLDAQHSIVPAPFATASSTALAPLFVRRPSDGGDGWGDDPSTPDTDESLNDDLGDLRLQPGSPAIDAGTNDFFTPGDLDLDGHPRLADDPGIPGANVDVGAYEFQGTTCLADVNQDGQLTPNDFNAWVLAFNNNSPLADQNRDGVVRQNDFNVWILNFNTGCP
ncbi:MAG: right-handed parallel beta-helix repeat-containing protein [Planctomycetota bacterium]